MVEARPPFKYVKLDDFMFDVAEYDVWKAGFENFSLSALSLVNVHTALNHRHDSVGEVSGRGPCKGFAIRFDGTK